MAHNQLRIADIAVLVAYLLVLVGIGFRVARRSKTTHDFFLAGHRIPWWAAGLSIFGTQLSAITFMAIPAKAYAEDWLFFPANMTIVLIAPVVAYLFLPFYRRLNLTTAYEYLEKRFSVAVRWFGSASFVLYQLGRMAVVLALPAIALAAVTGLNVYLCILVIGLLSTLYTVVGGIEAVIWTDVLQAVVLLGAALLGLALVFTAPGVDFTSVSAVVTANAKLRLFDWRFDVTTATAGVVVLGTLLGNLVPYTTDQSVIQRYLTTTDERAARRAIWTNALLTIPASVLFFSVGTALFAFYSLSEGSAPTLPVGTGADAIFPWFIATQAPAGLAGLVLAGLFAAAMSSLDSSLNSMSTALVTDFYVRLKPSSSEPGKLRLAKWLTAILGLVGTASALLLATFDIRSLWDTFLAVIGLLGGPLAGVFALGMFTKSANAAGALFGAAFGTVVLIYIWLATDVHFMLFAACGICTTFGIGWLFSRFKKGAPGTESALTLHKLRQDYSPESKAASP